MTKPSTIDTRDTGDDTNADAQSDSTRQPAAHNKAGHQQPTSRNEPRRTPESRHDRETHVGGTNQVQSRRGGGSR